MNESEYKTLIQNEFVRVFNTGRLYMKGGQPIAWVRLDKEDMIDGYDWYEPPKGQDWVFFVDFARGIDGIASIDRCDCFGEPLAPPEGDSAVLCAYDNYNYDRKGMPSPYGIRQNLKRTMERLCSEYLNGE